MLNRMLEQLDRARLDSSLLVVPVIEHLLAELIVICFILILQMIVVCSQKQRGFLRSLFGINRW